MALIIETGQGGIDSESYASVADADAYHAARGATNWATLTTTEKEQALRRATDHIGQAYRPRWKGYRVTTTQALDWPRHDVLREDGGAYSGGYYPSNAIPAELRNACALLALKAAGGDLAPDIEPLATREKVGPIEIERAPGSRQTVRYQAIDKLLAPLLKDGGSESMLRVVRA